MSKTIKSDELEKAITDYLNNYKENIDEDVVQVTDTITKQARDELKATSPKGNGKRSNPYHKGWAVKTSKKRNGLYQKVIWNKTNYQLTHLLEFGHIKRNGNDRTKAIPHIRPVEQKYNVKFVDLLENKIRRTK